MKIITVCGSLKFEEAIKIHTEKLALEGNCVLSIIYPNKDKDSYTNDEIQILKNEHYKKIELSDAIFVVNKNGYIGEDVRKEIEYAKERKKEILYLETLAGNDDIT
ncbi:MAG: hypothetical protein LBF63_01260 [Treponema sp.]|jgi:hypothetical protein|nr:hypothetical protein [Treponema sp.]